ncbi:MAG: PQQ-dependent sugar dehydrogenase [Devosia sp.]
MKSAFLAGLSAAAMLLALSAAAQDAPPGDDQLPGQQFHLTADSLPLPDAFVATNAAPPVKIDRGDHVPVVPPGFRQTLYIADFGAGRRLAVNPEDGVLYLAQQQLGRVMKLRDLQGDGTAETGALILEEALNPFGLAFVPGGDFAGDLLVADQDAVYRLPLKSVGFHIDQVTPDGHFGEPLGHLTHEVAIDPKTLEVYVSSGSVNNLAEEDPVKATIQRFNLDGTGGTTFAIGLRNVTGMDFEPTTGALYAVVMERDGMGDDLVPDFLTRVDEGDNFGWPYQYLGGFVQPKFRDTAPKLAAAKMPDVLFEAHSAPLDMAFIPDTWPEEYRGDALVALHGSYGASQPTGYKVVRVHFENGKPTGSYGNFMTGFWVSGDAPAEVWGRPAALAFAPDGALYVSDDFGNTIWRVLPPVAE